MNVNIELRGLNQLIDKQEKKLRALASEAIQDAAEQTIVRTPVDTGFARASWWASINSDSGDAPAEEEKTSGVAGSVITIARLSVTIDGTDLGDKLTIGNSASYIAALENGHSKQAPNGMVAVTVNEWPQVVNRVAQRIKPL